MVPKAYAAPPADALVSIASGWQEHPMTRATRKRLLIVVGGVVGLHLVPIPNIPGLFGR